MSADPAPPDPSPPASPAGPPNDGRPPPPAAGASVDAANPWLGLASFTEETRAFFFGRDEEIAELGRRVQRKLLTVLFGKSGLGKTSILRAGLVPLLRPAGFCPVYARLDYSAEAPPAAEQIKQAVFQASAAAGEWSRPGAARPGESLWEFFHHRDDVLRGAAGRPLVPLLIFDQFEEIFTLAQTDDAGRSRSRAFLSELADLVENRASASIEDDEASAERFDFARTDYRVLLALREDYLAHLEGLKDRMPSVTQNRLRLARMSGAQALEAVLRPGAGLVAEEVAGQIVRFVSGAADPAAAEVEPSLLSLVCRELNEARLGKGEAGISADLLAGSRETILAEFYGRSIADQPPGVRHFVEDRLLTDSGFRESVAEERVQRAFDQAGGPDSLRVLIDRRLLRIEERLDVRRVELTHDVLCGVVKASRDARRGREAAEAAERRARETEAREAAIRRALIRARAVALGCAVLAAVAVGGALFGYVNLRRARRAQAGEAAARALADAARSRAEREELAARRAAYDSEMNVAEQALLGSNLGRAQDLLDRQRPNPGQADLRGWEWRYLWRQTRSDALATVGRAGSEIVSLAPSADGRFLAVGALHRGGVTVWDLRAKRVSARLSEGDERAMAAFSPVGPLLAFATAGSFPGENGRFTLHLWNAATRKMIAERPLATVCVGLSFSEDGRRLVTADESPTAGSITLWRVPTLAVAARYPWNESAPAVECTFATTPDLRLAARALPQGRIDVVDLRDGAERWRAVASAASVALSPDGKTLATAAFSSDPTIRLWDVGTGREVGRLEGHTSYAASLLFSPDGRRLVSAGTDQTIRVWDVASRSCTDVLIGHRSEVWRLAWLPDGKTLVSGCKDGTVCLWDVSSRHPRPGSITWPGNIAAWRFSPDSRSVLTLDDRGRVGRWSGPDFRKDTNLFLISGRPSYARTLEFSYQDFSPDGRLLAIGSPQGDVGVWDVNRRIPWRKFGWAARGPAFPLRFFAEDRRLLVYTLSDGVVHDWNLATNREVRSWRAPQVYTYAVSPNGRLEFEGGWDGDILLRDLASNRVFDRKIDELEGVSAAFSRDGKYLAVSSALGYVRVWQTSTWTEVATLRDFLNAAWSADFSPDGRRLVTGGTNAKGAVKLWDVANWSEVLTLEGGGGGRILVATAFSPDGNCIGTLTWDGALQVWRAPSWAEIEQAEHGRADARR